MSNKKTPNFDYMPSREIEEVYINQNYPAFQDLNQQILIELLRKRTNAVKVVVKFYEEDTTP